MSPKETKIWSHSLYPGPSHKEFHRMSLVSLALRYPGSLQHSWWHLMPPPLGLLVLCAVPLERKAVAQLLTKSYIYIYGRGLVFWLCFWLFARQKQHIVGISRPKKGKRKKHKGRPKLVMFFWSKTALFPQFYADFWLKHRQKKRPWPYIYIHIYLCMYIYGCICMCTLVHKNITYI